ncbi:MAG TPA: sulfotransferase [Stellaceae bacterium]|nr:sulfotransferase [Stellaceae bacterium]
MTQKTMQGRAAGSRAPAGHPLAQAAIDCFRRGDTARAEALCRDVLSRVPDQVPALLLLGQILTERGEGVAAMSWLGRAVARRPDLAVAHFNMGRAAHSAGELRIAVAALRRATELDPHLAVAHRNLSAVLLETEQAGEALTHARRAIEIEPDLAENHFIAGKVLEALGRTDPAIGALSRATELEPTRVDLHNALGRLHQLAHRPDKAVQCHRRAVELQPDYALGHSYLASALQDIRDYAGAEAAYRRALELRPDMHITWNGFGIMLRALGRFDEAIAAFRRAIEISPDLGVAHRNLATVQKAAAEASEMAEMETILADTSLSLDARAQAGLGLGKWYDDMERYDEAFERYQRANHLTRQAEIREGKKFEPTALRAEVDRIIEVFTPEFFQARRAWGTETDLPVFIVGLFRSGTTLTEQVAASHPLVFGAGELNEVRQITHKLSLRPENAPEWQEDMVRKVAAAHLARLQFLGNGAVRVVDKNPDNVFSLGLIATMYPGARVIFCHRDGRDSALSCFFQGFSRSQSFASDLADCGRRWIETERLADHCRAAIPLRFHEVHYEAMVADLEGEARRLIEFLGLDWDPACLAFHETERSVKTASTWQVRQPLYNTSVGRWRHYERHIGPLLEVFAATGVSFDASAPGPESS